MYGLIVSFAIFISLNAAEKLATKSKLDINVLWRSSLWAIVAGVVGARLYHVIDFAYYYGQNPLSILFVHKGGLGIYGALIGGAIGFYFSLKSSVKGKKASLVDYFDVTAIVIPLGQAIGRWANLANKELFGVPTNLPWGLYVPPELRPIEYINNDIYHPIFLYESFLDILLFFVLLLLFRRKSVFAKNSNPKNPLFSLSGFFTLTYMIGYGFIRFSLEFLRINPWEILGINVAQGFSITFILVGIFGLLNLRKSSKIN